MTNICDVYIEVFGLADEEGIFLIKSLAEELEMCKHTGKEGVYERLQKVKEHHPDCMDCINSTMKILSSVVLTSDKLGIENGIVHRVYKRDDENKKPVMYVYANVSNEGKCFFVGDREQGDFIRNDARRI